MGLLLSRLYNLFDEAFNGQTARILMLGLDAAGEHWNFACNSVNEIKENYELVE